MKVVVGIKAPKHLCFRDFGHRLSIHPAVINNNSSSRLRSPSKLRARWGLFRSNQPRRPVCSTLYCRETTAVCPLASEPTKPLLGNYHAGQKLEIPGSRCHNQSRRRGSAHTSKICYFVVVALRKGFYWQCTISICNTMPIARTSWSECIFTQILSISKT